MVELHLPRPVLPAVPRASTQLEVLEGALCVRQAITSRRQDRLDVLAAPLVNFRDRQAKPVAHRVEPAITVLAAQGRVMQSVQVCILVTNIEVFIYMPCNILPPPNVKLF